MASAVNQMPEHSYIAPTIDRLDKDNAPSQLPALMGPPKQIACYSVNAMGVEFNITSLRYFVTPPLDANLNDGCHSFMRRYKDAIHRPQRLDSVLFACLQSDAKEYLSQADVVLRRGVLVKCVPR